MGVREGVGEGDGEGEGEGQASAHLLPHIHGQQDSDIGGSLDIVYDNSEIAAMRVDMESEVIKYSSSDFDSMFTASATLSEKDSDRFINYQPTQRPTNQPTYQPH